MQNLLWLPETPVNDKKTKTKSLTETKITMDRVDNWSGARSKRK